MKNMKSFITGVSFLLIFTIAVFLIFQILSAQKNEIKLSKQQLLQEAKAHFDGIVDTRFWNAKFGGVYVKPTSGLKPNPYLKDNILKLGDETLIKINPAWMTRQISKISNRRLAYHFKITSLKPLNPSNKADEFETKALKFFEKNPKKQYYYKYNDEEKSFDFMGALPTKQACLACHKHQGYKVGDIRGGIRVSIPTVLYAKQMELVELKTRNNIFIVISVALFILVIFYWFINMFYKRQFEVEHAKEILEEKVSQRTHALKVVVSKEQHLKDLLKIVTQVNEVLLKSSSIEAILESVTNKLMSNKSYSLIVSGSVHDNIFEIISQSDDEKNILGSNVAILKNRKRANSIFNLVSKSLELKHPIMRKISSMDLSDKLQKREDLNLKWVIALPVLYGFDDQVYGVIILFCSREDGFDLEETKILEKMSNDIGIAIYSHKQKDAILQMEKDKIENYEETVLAFVNIIEQRDAYTAGHTIRVAEYCAMIAREMGLGEVDIIRLEKAAILHDIGKVATPDTILLKPGRLSNLEYELIKQHSEVGADMLERVSMYKDLAEIIRYHHSRYDGYGYPRTKSPDEIPLLSHIMIVADAFDAMTTNRIYRPRKTLEEAIEELKRESGTQFHPDVVIAAVKCLKDVEIGLTSQLPISELEKRRMSYFFHDSLTELYNEDYLQTILKSHHPYKCLEILMLKKVTQFNKEHGWEEGNKLLKEFAMYLLEKYPKTIIIRYHGDDFVILSHECIKIDLQELSGFKYIANKDIDLEVSCFDIDKDFTYEDFEAIKL